MQFKYPELLYALVALLIPVIVHLFQLQRYTKVPFTNVQLLKSIQKETRKSAKLKKWLVLLTRLLAMACLIVAFAQPFTSASKNEGLKTAIYIDNSLSMKARGTNGELMRSHVNAILENETYSSDHLTFHSNFNSFNQQSTAQLKEALIRLNYQPYPVNFDAELLRINALNSNSENHRLVIISDFQNYQYPFPELLDGLNSETILLKTAPIRANNFAIDSVYTSDFSATNITINAVIKSQFPTSETIAVTLYNGPSIYGKTSVDLNQNNMGVASFMIPTGETFPGKLSIVDQALDFDNDFYFIYSIPKTIEILSIGDDSPYLRKIFDQNSFKYTNSPLNQLNYGNLPSKQFIILNELDTFSNALLAQIKEFVMNGGHLLVIPSENTDLDAYNKLFSALNMGRIGAKQTSALKITDIHFEHALFNNVFDRSVENFQYPSSTGYFLPDFKNTSTILAFQNKASFINSTAASNGLVYYVSSPLSAKNSNFRNSPLVVPVFYNMAAQSPGIQEIQYPITKNTRIAINTNIASDEVLSVQQEDFRFIPLQKVSKDRVTLELGDQLKRSGFYEVRKGATLINRIALNYSRKESDLSFVPIENLATTPAISIANSIDDLLTEIEAGYKINWYFKWFLAFSVLFLFFEMLILKYFKL